MDWKTTIQRIEPDQKRKTPTNQNHNCPNDPDLKNIIQKTAEDIIEYIDNTLIIQKKR